MTITETQKQAGYTRFPDPNNGRESTCEGNCASDRRQRRHSDSQYTTTTQLTRTQGRTRTRRLSDRKQRRHSDHRQDIAGQRTRTQGHTGTHGTRHGGESTHKVPFPDNN